MTFLQGIANGWWQWTAPMSVQLAFLVLIVAVMDRVLRPWIWPRLRFALWMLVVVKLLLPPTLSSPLSVARLDTGVGSTNLGEGGTVTVTLFSIWLAGFLLCTVLIAVRYVRLRRTWLTGSRPLSRSTDAILCRAVSRLRMRRTPDVRIQRRVRTPAVVGFLRPVIILPETLLESASPRQLEHVLLHELAHVARRDPMWSLACLAVQLVYWFHPLVWFARRRIAFLREVCCDETVTRALDGETIAYRRTLLEMARPLLGAPPLGQLGFIHRHSQLLARLRLLERSPTHRSWPRRLVTAALCGTLLLCCVPVAAAPTNTLAALADLPGCLQMRYIVYGMLGEQASDAP